MKYAFQAEIGPLYVVLYIAVLNTTEDYFDIKERIIKYRPVSR